MTNFWKLAAVSAALLLTGCRGCEAEKRDETVHMNPPPPASSAPPVPPVPSGVGKSQGGPIPLLEHLRFTRRSEGVQFVNPTPAEGKAFVSWVTAVSRAAWSDRLPFEAAPAGFEGVLAELGTLWLLREKSSHRRGAGAYVLRASVGRPLILQAPHTFFDAGTLPIATRLFEGLQAKALLINTVHRSGGREGEGEEEKEKARGGKSEADVAHNRESFYSLVHQALLSLDPTLLVVQIHGFRDSKVPGVDLVVSAARTQADIKPMGQSMKALLGSNRVRLYPDEVKVLGGTTNAQASLSREHRASFIHLELSATLRKTLEKDDEFFAKFLQAFSLAIPEGRR
ncbi:MAG: hypothetical protein SFV15_00550 [Polyangiaceae bacterium]|nr:hypothetical protein [Polyangiaceae bacterium]